MEGEKVSRSVIEGELVVTESEKVSQSLKLMGKRRREGRGGSEAENLEAGGRKM